jgi:hypothetical protein
MKKIFLFLIAFLSIVACSKSDSGSSDNGGYALKLLKTEATVQAIVIHYQNGVETQTTAIDLSKGDYILELKSEPLQLAVGGTGKSDTTVLIAQFLKNGKVQNQISSKGLILNLSF